MLKKTNIIDIFVAIVDNYGDMGFACELVMALRNEYGKEIECIIWADDVTTLKTFIRRSGIEDIPVFHVGEFGKLRKSTIAISALHTPIPNLDVFEMYALILRIDYLSLDPDWLVYNETEHISSTKDRQIIELIPSPLEGGAVLLQPIAPPHLMYEQKHIAIFTYSSTLEYIDWDSFPSDLLVYVFGSIITNHKNIICLDWLPLFEYYGLLDTSEFTIVRGEVSGVHSIQAGVPFFWDMYRGIGGFPIDQSEQILSLLAASPEYREAHQILNGQKPGKIIYSDLVRALSHTRFRPIRTSNLVHTIKKYIDRFNNSI